MFFFYANEHEPRHIHVTKGSEFAKIELALKKSMTQKKQNKHILMLKKIYSRADQICKKNKRLDRETVVQTLFSLRKSPTDRLRLSLHRAQKITLY